MVSVHLLKPQLGDSWTSFGVDDIEPIRHGLSLFTDFIPPGPWNRGWTMARLAPHWRPHKLVNPTYA